MVLAGFLPFGTGAGCGLGLGTQAPIRVLPTPYRNPRRESFPLLILHNLELDTFLEWQSGTLVTPSGALRLLPTQKLQAVWLFAQPVRFFDAWPPDEFSEP